MSNSGNNFGPFCSVSSIDSEESEVSEVEDDLETVEPYQFEPVASDSSQSQIQRHKMRMTLESKIDSAAETGMNLHA